MHHGEHGINLLLTNIDSRLTKGHGSTILEGKHTQNYETIKHDIFKRTFSSVQPKYSHSSEKQVTKGWIYESN